MRPTITTSLNEMESAINAQDTSFSIDMTLDKDFVQMLHYLNDTYGIEFSAMNGFSNQNLNFSDFINNFIDTKVVADVVLDSTANNSGHDICTLTSDMTKPHSKLLAYNKIFYELKKKYGLEQARKWLLGDWNGAGYLHDAPSSSFVPYCYAYDLDQVAEKGLFFINKFKTKAPQHLTTFNDHVLEFIGWATNRTSGAVGLPSYLVYSWYFWDKDVRNNFYLKDPEYYRRQCFQKFVYDLNQPYLRITQSAFTNISIMDHCYLEELFGGREFPDGTFAIDHIDEIIEHQKVFMEVIAETREELMMTYPVLTYSLLFKDGKFVDEEFARWCSDHNTIWYDSNFYNGSDVTSLSNCCFDKNQKVLVKNGETVILESFGNLEAECYKDFRKDMKIFHNGNWVSGKLIKLPASKMYKVTTVNNKTMILTDNHINPTMLGNKETKDLTTDDYLLFNIRVLGSIYSAEKQLKYFHGALIGLYMKYGSMVSDTDIMFTVDHRLYSAILSILKSIVKTLDPESVDHITCEVSDDEATPNYINIYSKSIHDFINLYVTHYYEKSLNMQVLLQSLEFRMGILGGMIEDDENPHYTETSISNADKVEALLSSVGASTRIEEVKVSKNGSEYIEYHIYSYHIYEDRYVEDTYRVCNNSVYFKIKSIEEISNYNEKYVYCFEMKDKDEPYFTLPNGIITHNCRLISDTSKLDPFINSIGGTSLSIGSVKVNTINLRRIALESNQDEEKFINILKERIDTTVKTLDVVRHIIMRNIEKGLLPNYSYKLIEIDKQYNTIGITAMFEALKEFDYIDCDEFGNYSYSNKAINFAQRIMNTINEQKESYNFDYRLNVENIPKNVWG